MDEVVYSGLWMKSIWLEKYNYNYGKLVINLLMDER